MRNLILCCLISLFAGTLHAQTFSGGFRAGMSGWRYYNDNLEGRTAGTSFTKEVFIRSVFEKWAFETGLSHDHYKSDQIPDPDRYSQLPAYFQEMRTSYQLRLKGSYELLGACKGPWPVLKRFKNYIGVVVSPAIADISTSEAWISPPYNPGTGSRREFRYIKLELWLGFSNTLEYWFNDRFSAAAELSVEANPFKRESWNYNSLASANYFPNARFTGALGLACRF